MIVVTYVCSNCSESYNVRCYVHEDAMKELEAKRLPKGWKIFRNPLHDWDEIVCEKCVADVEEWHSWLKENEV